MKKNSFTKILKSNSNVIFTCIVYLKMAGFNESLIVILVVYYMCHFG